MNVFVSCLQTTLNSILEFRLFLPFLQRFLHYDVKGYDIVSKFCKIGISPYSSESIAFPLNFAIDDLRSKLFET